MQKTYMNGYYATEDGKIYSDKTGTLKPLSIHRRSDGYDDVRTVEGKRLVHRLVASAFLGNVTGLTVNHKDGDKVNNTVANLEIVTMRENIHHAFRTGLSPVGANHGRTMHSDEILLDALASVSAGASVRSVAKRLGISQSYLNKVKNRVYRKSLDVEVHD